MDKAIETVKDMITQRGYKINLVKEDYIKGVKKNYTDIIFFTTPIHKFNVDQVKIVLKKLYDMKEQHCIIIYIDNITSTAKKTIAISEDYQIELFNKTELQYNLTKHRLVPKHIKLNKSGSREFKKKFGTQFPAILIGDPVSRFYNFKIGDIIKIIRKNGYISYRIVMSNKK